MSPYRHTHCTTHGGRTYTGEEAPQPGCEGVGGCASSPISGSRYCVGHLDGMPSGAPLCAVRGCDESTGGFTVCDTHEKQRDNHGYHDTAEWLFAGGPSLEPTPTEHDLRRQFAAREMMGEKAQSPIVVNLTIDPETIAQAGRAMGEMMFAASKRAAEGATMSNQKPPEKSQIRKTLEADAIEAGYRIAGRQLTKAARDTVAALLCRGIEDDSPETRAKITRFLRTETGSALVSAICAGGLALAPESDKGRTQRLVRELRVSALETVGGVLADKVVDPILSLATAALKGIPTEAPALEARQQETLAGVEEAVTVGVGRTAEGGER